MLTNPIHVEGEHTPGAKNADLQACTPMSDEEFAAAIAALPQADGPSMSATAAGTPYISYGMIVPDRKYGWPMLLESIKWAMEQSGFGDRAKIIWRTKPTLEPYKSDAHRAGKMWVARARFAVEEADAK